MKFFPGEKEVEVSFGIWRLLSTAFVQLVNRCHWYIWYIQEITPKEPCVSEADNIISCKLLWDRYVFKHVTRNVVSLKY